MNTAPYFRLSTPASSPPTAVLTPSNFFGSCLRRSIASQQEISQSSLLHDAFPMYQSQSTAVIGPVFGASAAAIVAETLIVSGTKRLLLFGFAGGIGFHPSEPQAGDVILGGDALCETGMTNLYGESQELTYKESDLRETVRSSFAKTQPDLRLHVGTIWSTSIPLEESAEKAEKFAQGGALGVEMEYAAVLSVALKHEVELLGVFIVSDILEQSHQAHFAKVKRSGIVQAISDSLATLLC